MFGQWSTNAGIFPLKCRRVLLLPRALYESPAYFTSVTLLWHTMTKYQKIIWWKLFDTQSSNTELKPGPERKIGTQFQNPSSQTRRTSFATPFQAISPQFSGSTGPLYNMFPVFNFLTKKYITWSKRVAGEDVWTSGRHWQDHQTSTKHGNAVTASRKNSKQQHQRLKNDYDQSKSVFWFESLQASWNI